jgi:hypothetical protein
MQATVDRWMKALVTHMSVGARRRSWPSRTFTVRNHCAVRSERSPLHDVRQHAPCGRLMEKHKRKREFVFLRTSNLRVRRRSPTGGARRDRTDDLLLAKQALSQLSYGPSPAKPETSATAAMVGLGRFELPTSRLSSARSNQLSYRPNSYQSEALDAPP